MGARIRIETKGLDALIRALDNTATRGPVCVQEALDAALRRTAETSRALAHVSHDHRHSGSLKASQTTQTEHGAGGWSGTIAYGDRGAHWEMERGGEHAAFVENLSTMSVEDFQHALDTMFMDL